MNNQKTVFQSIDKLIKKSTTIFISGHLRPDGDTVGSQLSLASLLRRLGKIPIVYNHDPIPPNLRFLPGVENILIKKKCKDKFDLGIILECSDVNRMGNVIDIKSQVKWTVNIDHHLIHSNFADVNYVDHNLSSSAEMVWNLFEYYNVIPNFDEAICLYTGILTDTGNFQHSNTTPKVLKIASDLMSKGIRPDLLHSQIYEQRSMESMRFLSYVLKNFKLLLNNKVAIVTIPKEKLRHGARDSEEIISYLLMVASVKVGVFIRQINKEVRISFRSKGNINVAKVAEHFGGGGHRNAAGLSLYCGLRKSKDLVLNQIKNIV
ncbi:MAG: bifunctional oligoribonuclease/PAP phosphatase NrnA [bacterium]